MSVIMQEGLRAVIIFDSDGIFRGFVGIVKIIITAKFPELSQNFPKLADWAVLGWSSFLAALGAGIFKHAGIILHTSVEEDFKHRVTTKNSTPMVAVRSTIIELIARDDVVSMSKMAAIIDFRVHIK